MRAAAGMAGLVLVVSLTACGGESTPTIESAGTVSEPAGSVPQVTITDGEDSYTSGGSLPEAFPKDIVKFPLGFVLGHAQEQNNGQGPSWLVMGTVDNPRSPVAANLETFYGPPDGTSGDVSYPNDQAAVFSWDNHDGYAMVFTLTTNYDGHTVVSAAVRKADG